MMITKQQLSRLIKEELQILLETHPGHPGHGDCDGDGVKDFADADPCGGGVADLEIPGWEWVSEEHVEENVLQMSELRELIKAAAEAEVDEKDPVYLAALEKVRAADERQDIVDRGLRLPGEDEWDREGPYY